jgi:hypothetical protein
MSLVDDLFMIAIVCALAYAAWVYQIKPELQRRKSEEANKLSESKDAPK